MKRKDIYLQCNSVSKAIKKSLIMHKKQIKMLIIDYKKMLKLSSKVLKGQIVIQILKLRK
ncbi:Uncharacterised protein [Mycobacteroides abscessus]|nr:Uncharacterised protein [Mycobacteroides abscessus]